MNIDQKNRFITIVKLVEKQIISNFQQQIKKSSEGKFVAKLHFFDINDRIIHSIELYVSSTTIPTEFV